MGRPAPTRRRSSRRGAKTGTAAGRRTPPAEPRPQGGRPPVARHTATAAAARAPPRWPPRGERPAHRPCLGRARGVAVPANALGTSASTHASHGRPRGCPRACKRRHGLASGSTARRTRGKQQRLGVRSFSPPPAWRPATFKRSLHPALGSASQMLLPFFPKQVHGTASMP